MHMDFENKKSKKYKNKNELINENNSNGKKTKNELAKIKEDKGEKKRNVNSKTHKIKSALV